MNRLEQLQQFLAQSPNDGFILFAIAKEYENQQDTENALAYYLKLKAADSNYVGLYYHLAKLYEKLQQFEIAMTTYQEGIQVAQKAGDRHALGELNQAMEILEDVMDEL